MVVALRWNILTTWSVILCRKTQKPFWFLQWFCDKFIPKIVFCISWLSILENHKTHPFQFICVFAKIKWIEKDGVEFYSCYYFWNQISSFGENLVNFALEISILASPFHTFTPCSISFILSPLAEYLSHFHTFTLSHFHTFILFSISFRFSQFNTFLNIFHTFTLSSISFRNRSISLIQNWSKPFGNQRWSFLWKIALRKERKQYST